MLDRYFTVIGVVKIDRFVGFAVVVKLFRVARVGS